MNNALITGYYAYQSHGDGLCCYATKGAAVRNASIASRRESVAVIVFSPTGLVVHIAR